MATGWINKHIKIFFYLHNQINERKIIQFDKFGDLQFSE